MTKQIRCFLLAFLLNIAGGTIAGANIGEQLSSSGPGSKVEGKGVVLLSVRWDRRWTCGQFENTQLRAIGFDKQPSTKTDEAAPDLLLDDAPKLFTKPKFDNYAFLVEPGEYGLSTLEIKVARSVSDVGSFKVPRTRFMKEGKSSGGTFNVASGETVYLGHFYLDCATAQPIMWRYYPEDREAFQQFLASVKGEMPWLDASKVQFRLFETEEFGHSFKLP